MIRPLSIIGLHLTFALLAGEVSASCLPTATTSEKIAIRAAIDVSAAVFSGAVTAIEYVKPDGPAVDWSVKLIKVEPDVWWKGPRNKEVTLRTANVRLSDGRIIEGSEDYSFEVGKKYLIYAVENPYGLYSNRCTRTKMLDAATSDVAALDALVGEDR